MMAALRRLGRLGCRRPFACCWPSRNRAFCDCCELCTGSVRRDAERLLARDERGQMTVELCLFLPVAIVVAVIAVNAMTFFGECAEFDRISRNAVRTHAASPGYDEDSTEVSALVGAALDEAFSAENLSCEVSVSSDYQGLSTYEMTLSYQPTLFGMGLKSEVLGVAMPSLKHTSRLTVQPYKPGMLF